MKPAMPHIDNKIKASPRRFHVWRDWGAKKGDWTVLYGVAGWTGPGSNDSIANSLTTQSPCG
jgi:hypothetical protein